MTLYILNRAVLSDGSISQVAVQRSDFRGLIASGGAPALQAGLERKVANLSNGALASGVGALRPVRLISTSRGRPRTPDAAASRPQSRQRQIAHSQGHQHRRHTSHRGSLPEPAHVNGADAEPLPLHSRDERSG